MNIHVSTASKRQKQTKLLLLKQRKSKIMWGSKKTVSLRERQPILINEDNAKVITQQKVQHVTYYAYSHVDAKTITVGEDNKACAKRENHRFYLKVSRAAHNYGKLFNPWDTFGARGDEQKTQFGDEKVFVWKEVSSKSFDSYMRFLQTKNLVHLRTSEMEI
jgi:hypothetical protein